MLGSPCTAVVAFRQRWTGAYSRGGPLDQPICLQLAAPAGAPALRAFVRERVVEVRGVIDARGLAEERPVEGDVQVDRNVARYALAFEGDDGEPYQFVGEQELSIRLGPAGATVLAGTLSSRGDPVGRARLRFDARKDLWELLSGIVLYMGRN